VRKERDKLLAETDYIHLRDVTVSDTFKANMINLSSGSQRYTLNC